MKKDLTRNSFREIEDAAKQILDAYGQFIPGESGKKYSSDNLTFIKLGNIITIKHNDVIVFQSPILKEGKLFLPDDDWIDEVEHIAQSIKKGGLE